MHRAIKPHPHHLRDTSGIIAIGLVDLCLQPRPHVPRLNTDHRQACFGERTEQPLRQRSSFQSNPLEAIAPVRQNREQRIRFARNSHLARNLSSIIHNADARVLDRYVQSSKMVHAALLLMLGARTTVTPFHHQPEAQHPKNLSAIHKLPADYPIFWHNADTPRRSSNVRQRILRCHFPGAVKTPCAIRPSRPPSISCTPSATWLTPRITPRSSNSGLNQRKTICATNKASQSRNRME